MTTEIRSIIAGALFGLAVLLVIYGVRRVVMGKARDAADRRRGLQAIAAAFAALTASAYLIADASG
jgi:hypothetical protein